MASESHRLIANSLLSGASTILAGRGQARQAVTEAALAERQAKDVDVQSLQMSERRREDLVAAISSITASRAARGLSDDSPSAVAVEREVRRQSVRDEGADRLGYMNQANALRMSATARKKGAKNAMYASYLGAGSTVWAGAQDAADAAKAAAAARGAG